MSYLSIALALIQIVNWLVGQLDAAAKEKAIRAIVEQENLKNDLKAINDANRARDDVLRDISSGVRGVRTPDEDARAAPRPGKGGV